MIDELKIYNFVGVIYTAFIPYDIDLKIESTTKQGAKLKAFQKLKNSIYFKNMPRDILIKKINKLRMIEIK